MQNNPKQQITIIATSTVLAGFSLASIINFTDPAKSSALTFGFFYISLFLLTLGIFALIGLLLRHWLSQGLFMANLANSFRQAFLIATLVIISFVLLSQGLLLWWVEASLILFFAFFEIFMNLKI